MFPVGGEGGVVKGMRPWVLERGGKKGGMRWDEQRSNSQLSAASTDREGWWPWEERKVSGRRRARG
jgi:hypothetical protein